MTVHDRRAVDEETLAVSGTAGPVMVMGRPSCAPLVVAPLDDGEAGVALWAFTLSGAPCGAWIRRPAAEHELQERSVRALLQRRALLGHSPDDVARLLTTLGCIGDEEAASVRSRYLDPVAALNQIRRHRDGLQAAVQEHARATGRNLAALTWDPLPAGREVHDVDGLLTVLAPPTLGVAPARAALQLVAVARWLLNAWADTEAARLRRAYLRGTDTDPQPLPPCWAQAVRNAYDAPTVIG
jgi:hypothetical protein